MAISGVGVAIVTAGALLIYSGLQNQNPLKSLKDIASGKPTGVSNVSSSTLTNVPIPSAPITIPGNNVGGMSGLAAVILKNFSQDKYTENVLQRLSNGYSDCSSIVRKALILVGAKNPPFNTYGFLASREWGAVPEAEVRPGDIAINGSHMVTVGGRQSNGTLYGIGQQNPRRNVQQDTIKNLMATTGAFSYLRYKPIDLSQVG